jgi:phosphoglycerate dehydrogenase-like enzyme
MPLRQSTLGIVGLGRIGRSLATRAKGMGMKLIAAELYPDLAFVEEHGIRLVDLDTLLAEADYVSLNCPLSDETRGLIDADKLSRMKPSGVLVNTARGGLVVEADLVEAIRAGAIGGAGLDVFEQEPTNPKNPLYDFENVVVSPHIAGTDSLALDSMAAEAARCIVDLSKGVWPDGAVINNELKGKWRW